MSGFLILAAYVAVGAATWMKIYVAFYEHHHRTYTRLEWDGSDRAAGIYFSTCGALFWPPVLVAIAFYRLVIPFTRRLEGGPR